jgi:hypothetical protein
MGPYAVFVQEAQYIDVPVFGKEFFFLVPVTGKDAYDAEITGKPFVILDMGNDPFDRKTGIGKINNHDFWKIVIQKFNDVFSLGEKF